MDPILPAIRYTNLNNHFLLDGDPDPRKPDEVYCLVDGQLIDKEDFFRKKRPFMGDCCT